MTDNPITPLSPTEAQNQEASTLKESYIHRVLVAVDVFANVIANGNPDETISSRAARASTQGKMWGKALSSFLNVFSKDHGAKAEAADLARGKYVEQVEESTGTVPKTGN